MPPETLIAARPHFRREGNQLFFFLSKRVFRSLTPAELSVWDQLQSGPIRWKEAADVPAAQSLVDAGIAEIIEPITERNRRPILVIEPHCDDAALSIGATMWKMRHEVEFHLLTMASRSNYTTAFHLHRDYFDRTRITAMRTAEGELFARHLGGQYYCADLAEATLRYADSDWDLDFFNAHGVPVAISNNRRAPRAILDSWIERLRSFLIGRHFNEIWIPLGAGTHADHDLARNASLEVILEDHPSGVVRLYEDVPYGTEFQEHTDRILNVLRGAGARLTPWFQAVAAEYPTKLALLSVFASQFKAPSIEPGVKRSAHSGGPTSPIERLWTLESLPNHLLEDELWVGAADVARASAALSRFLEGASAESRLAVFAIGAAGRWSEDLKLLSDTFPAAKFVVYAGPRVCAEFAAHKHARVELHCLDGRSISWVRAALREVSTGHRIVIAGDASGKAKALTMLWPTGRNIVAAAMDPISQVLAKADQSA